MRWLLAAIVALLVGIIGVWFAYGEARTALQAIPKRLRAMRQARDFRRLTPQWQAIVRALDPEAAPPRRLTVAAITTVIPGGHPRLHQ